MKTLKINALLWCLLGVMFIAPSFASAQTEKASSDSLDVVYPVPEHKEFGEEENPDESNLYLKDPSNLNKAVEYDYESGRYIFTERIGDIDYRLPRAMTLEEYSKYDLERSVRNYWKQRNSDVEEQVRQGLIPEFEVDSEAFSKIFGGTTISIIPQGFVEVSFGYKVTNTENPAISERLRKVGIFDFDQQIQMGLSGSIGERMNMQVNYNTESSFTFENQMNLEYAGGEDEIIKKIEAGNVSLPLNGSLITGATNLFGIRADLQFGKLSLSTILSQSEGEKQTINVENGAQQTDFEISASDYDANRHFFLSHYFRDTYDASLKDLPVIRSGISINRIEVWVTNKSGDYTSSRDILATIDLAEHQDNIYNTVPQFQEGAGQAYPSSIVPYNDANEMYSELTTTYSGIRDVSSISSTLYPLASYDFQGGQDYEKIEQARMLDASEYTVNEELGYISLNSALNTDEVLAVAYNYTYNGQVFQVGEFSTDGIDSPNTLILKLLKGTNLSPQIPTWDLMMKNVYSLNTFSLTDEDFKLNILYQNNETGTKVNYLPSSNLEGHILLNVMNLDDLNSNLDLGSNGVFDYVEGVTVNSSLGQIIFPVVEPFGSHLEDSINSPSDKELYAFTSLYDSTAVYAEQDAEHNKFYLSGSYSGSSSSEISVGAVNLSAGSVTVTSGGVTLVEGVDYVVDYTLGRVQIINSNYLQSGASLQVTTESQDLFTVQRKSLIGAHANYAFSDNFNLGATVLYMNERPITQKVNYGEDPISNTMLGLDLRYYNESQFLTNLVNKIPLIETDAMSSIALDAEYAKLITSSNSTTDGAVYIDDFENTQTDIDVSQAQEWHIASVPQHQSDFPEGDLPDSIASGFNRAKLAWYTIDPIFTRTTSLTPNHILSDPDQQSDNFVREVYQQEIFPDRDIEIGSSTVLSVLNLAYYPDERGQYNFDSQPTTVSSGINADGSLKNPASRWGGIMREVETTNFEAANVEYIEFWMMDPFINDSSNTMTGADLYFNLGEVSEDILRDSRKMYENGLPEDENIVNVDTTTWGRVPTQTQITNAFVSSDIAIINQDVGLDGLSSSEEQSFYTSYLNNLQSILNPDVYSTVASDPSGDDYHYYRGSDYDEAETSILDRYKDYNGVDGNSIPAANSPESYSTSATSIPDDEDLNDDNTLNEYERYYQYKVSLRPEDMVVGENHITDARTVTVEVENGNTTTTWYKFRIPVNTPDASYGSISDFTSIRFMRMFLKNSVDEMHLRFATMSLVRSEWRQYTEDLEGDSPETAYPNTSFSTGSVNIEEDANRSPVNYVLPPNIDRVIDPSSSQLLALNEQAMTLQVENLEQGDSRAAYKSIGMDFRLYENIKMDVHAEALSGEALEDGDLYFFVRLGSDYNDNYYEYELPLSLTESGIYNSDIESDRYKVWPDANRLDFPLSVFTDAKLERNELMHTSGSGVGLTDEYSTVHSGYNSNRNFVKIKGNPTLSDVDVMMFGVRHKDGTVVSTPKSVEVWVNELRLTEAESNGGWAASGRASMTLADFGNVVVSGRHRSAGFGSIDQSVSERALDDLSEYDISTNLELGKFFPEKAKVKVPLYVGISKSVSTPTYDPLNPDLTLEESLEAADSKEERDSIKNIAQTYSKSSSIILNNVKVDKVNKSGKPRVYDPTNFSISFMRNKGKYRDENTEYDIERTTRFAFNYNFNNQPKVYEPFKNVVKSPVLGLIRDFNFSLMPTVLAFRSEIYRYYNEIQTRDITNSDLSIPVTVEKDFLWTNDFNMTYNLAKSLEINFTSEGTNRIDEEAGRLNKADDDYQQKKDSIMENFWNMGRPILYQHSLNATYQLPINKIGMLDWVTSTARYQGIYAWEAGAITEETLELGNTIDNSRIIQLNGQASLVNLYNKVPYLKQVNQRFEGRSNNRRTRSTERRTEPEEGEEGESAKKERPTTTKMVSYEKSNVSFEANKPKIIKHNLKTQSISVKLYDNNGNQIRGVVTPIDDNTISYTVSNDIANGDLEIAGRRVVEQTVAKDIAAYAARFLMMIRSANVTYSSSDGTILPGFLPEPSFLGGGNYNADVGLGNIASSYAPGLKFLAGWQDEDFAKEAAEKGWITTDSTLNSPYIMTSRETWDFRLNIEPAKSLKIDMTANRSMSENMSEYYLYDGSSNSFGAYNRNLTGSFTMSINTWKTAFSDMGEANVQTSEAYNDMLNNRLVIAQRLAAKRKANSSAGYDPTDVDPETGFPVGYGPTSQEVLLPAFIAGYTGQSASKVSLDPFPSLAHMSPNWRINYSGNVSEINGLNKFAKSIVLSHAYQSSYSIGQYQTNLNYDDSFYGDGYSYVTGSNDNFVPQEDITSATIVELFNPLINLDVTWINDLSTSVEFNRSRNMTLSLTNNQMTEVISREVSFGLGYTFPRMDIFFKSRGGQTKLSNDLNIRADVGIRKDKTLLRKLVESDEQLTAGQKAVTITTTADYQLSDRFQLRLYYDRVVNTPYTSNSFPTATTSFGMSVRLMLLQSQ